MMKYLIWMIRSCLYSTYQCKQQTRDNRVRRWYVYTYFLCYTALSWICKYCSYKFGSQLFKHQGLITAQRTGCSDPYIYRAKTLFTESRGWANNRIYQCIHDDVMKWKYYPRYWPFVRGIHRSPVNSPHKAQWRGALMYIVRNVSYYLWLA